MDRDDICKEPSSVRRRAKQALAAGAIGAIIAIFAVGCGNEDEA